MQPVARALCTRESYRKRRKSLGLETRRPGAEGNGEPDALPCGALGSIVTSPRKSRSVAWLPMVTRNGNTAAFGEVSDRNKRSGLPGLTTETSDKVDANKAKIKEVRNSDKLHLQWIFTLIQKDLHFHKQKYLNKKQLSNKRVLSKLKY